MTTAVQQSVLGVLGVVAVVECARALECVLRSGSYPHTVARIMGNVRDTAFVVGAVGLAAPHVFAGCPKPGLAVVSTVGILTGAYLVLELATNLAVSSRPSSPELKPEADDEL